MAKKHNRFIIDTSCRGKFKTDIVVHALPPRYIAEVILVDDAVRSEIFESMDGLPFSELAFSEKQLPSGKWVILTVICWWDYVETNSPVELKAALESVKLGLKSYISYMIDMVRESTVNAAEINDCISFIDNSIINSEAKYVIERGEKPSEEQELFRRNVVVAKWIRKYLKQLRDLSYKINNKL